MLVMLIPLQMVLYLYPAEEPAQKSMPLNAVVIFDEGEGIELEKARAGIAWALVSTIFAALDQDVIVVATASMMNVLKELYKKCGQDKEMVRLVEGATANGYISIYNDYVVLIPKKYQDIPLSNFGFNQASLRQMGVWNMFNTCLPRINIGIKNFIDLFLKADDPMQLNAKQFFISGHGAEATDIVGLAPARYMELLQQLNTIHTEFVYVASCYAGGANLLRMHNLLEEKQGELDIGALNYIFVIGATTDEIARVMLGGSSLRDFFTALNAFLGSPRMYLKLPMQRRPSVGISDVLDTLYRSVPDLTNIWSVRFPGVNTFFRAGADDVLIITYAGLKRYILESQFKYILDKKKGLAVPQEMPKPSIDVSKSKRAVLVYPVDVRGINFLFFPGQMIYPLFISAIPGKAFHMIEQMRGELFFRGLIWGIFFRPLATGEEYFGVSNKAWFIGEVLSSNQSLRNVVVVKMIKGKSILLNVEESGKGKVYRLATFKLPISIDNFASAGYVEHFEISKSVYDELIRIIKDITMPLPEAIREASGRNETVESVNSAFAEMLTSWGVDEPVFDQTTINEAREAVSSTNYLITRAGVNILKKAIRAGFSSDILPIARELIKNNSTIGDGLELFKLLSDQGFVHKELANALALILRGGISEQSDGESVANKLLEQKEYQSAFEIAQAALWFDDQEANMIGTNLMKKLVKNPEYYELIVAFAKQLLNEGNEFSAIVLCDIIAWESVRDDNELREKLISAIKSQKSWPLAQTLQKKLESEGLWH